MNLAAQLYRMVNMQIYRDYSIKVSRTVAYRSLYGFLLGCHSKIFRAISRNCRAALLRYRSFR